MPQEYEEAYSRFVEYLDSEIVKMTQYMGKYNELKEVNDIYESLRSYDVDKYILHAEKLLSIDESMKNDIELIRFFKEEGIILAEQMSSSMKNILNNAKLLELVNEFKEYNATDYEEKIRMFEWIKNNPSYSKEFKEVLFSSGLSDEDVLIILRGKAFESIIVPTKNEKFTEVKEEKKENPKYKELDEKVEAFIQKYYYLLQDKKTVDDKLFKMYEKFLNVKTLDEDNKSHLVDLIKGFADKEVSLALLVTYLITKKELAKEIDNEELEELYYEEIEKVYMTAIEVAALYDKEKLEELPLDANVYVLLENGRPLFDLDGLNDQERETLIELIHELELGKFDYINGKASHPRVEQTIRRDLNVFVNRKSTSTISFVRVNDETLTDSKVLVLSFASQKGKTIFEASKYILKKKSDLIDGALESIKTQDEAFQEEQRAFMNDELMSSSGRGLK